MNRINNFINQETVLTPTKAALLLAGTAISVGSPISIYNTWGAYNQNVFRAVFLANVIKSQKPNSVFSNLVSKANLVTIPYFFGLTAYSIYSSPQIPKLIAAVGALREKLPSPAQVLEAVQTLREKLPSQAEVMKTLEDIREKVSSQVTEALGSVREKLPSNMTERAYVLRDSAYQQLSENKSYILIGAIASVAVVSFISYCACRFRKNPKQV